MDSKFFQPECVNGSLENRIYSIALRDGMFGIINYCSTIGTIILPTNLLCFVQHYDRSNE